MRYPCTFCDKVFQSDAELSNHLSQCHDFKCAECKERFTIESELKGHVNTMHEGRNKRHRGDTSLMDLDNDCISCVCKDFKEENEKLKQEVQEAQNRNLEINHLLLLSKQSNEAVNIELEGAKKGLEGKNEKIKTLEKDILSKADFVSPETRNNEINQLKNRAEAVEKELNEKVIEVEAAKKENEDKNERIKSLEKDIQSRRGSASPEAENHEINQLKTKVEVLEKDVKEKLIENQKLKSDIDVLRKDLEESENQDSQQELQRLRTIVQDREKSMKKASENHKKELTELERAKKNAEENLNSAIQENMKIKEKDDTMYEIMDGLRKLLDIKDRNKNEKENSPADDEPDVEVINEGASGGAIPKHNLTSSSTFSCQKCKYQSTNMNALNKHVRNEHLATLYPCVKCDLQAKTIQELRNHERMCLNTMNHFECSKCTFVGTSKENLASHMTLHNDIVIDCGLCNNTFDSQSGFSEHERLVHMKSKYVCDICTSYFTNYKNLEDHKRNKHNAGLFPCNECRFKAVSLNQLDKHIGECHGYPNQDKGIDMRDVSYKKSCNPSHPKHTSECCDRVPQHNSSQKSNDEERRRRGQCWYWSQGSCTKGDSCRFAHIKLCKFQDQCFYYESCRFFHYSEQKDFLGSRGRKKEFVFQEEEFPPLHNSRRGRRNL